MTSSYLKTSVFVRPHENDNPAFSKSLTLGTVFKNLRFWCPKPLFTCGRKDRKKENLRYSTKYPDTGGRSLQGTFTVSKRKTHKRKKETSYLLGVHQVYVTCNNQDTCYSRQAFLLQIRNVSKPRFLTYLSRLSFRCFISTFSAMSSTKDLRKRLS